MAFVWADQPFFYTTATATQRYNSFTGTISNAVIPRANTAAYVGAAVTNCAYKTLGSDGGLVPSGATAIIGIRFRTTTLGANNGGGYFLPCLFQVHDAASPQISVTMNTDGTLAVRRAGANGTIIGSTTYALLINTWYYVELKVLISATVGTVDLYVDGVNKLSLTGQNTRGTATTTWNGFSLGQNASSGGAGTYYHTDVYVLDGTDGTGLVPAQVAAYNDVLGDVKVEYLGAVAGNGTNVAWTLSTGADHGALVDDGSAGPNGDTDYIYATTTLLKDSFVIADLASTAVAIKAVLPVYSASKDDAGSKQIKPMFRIAGTDYLGTALEAPSVGSYFVQTEVITKSPATGVAWTPTEVNAMEAGVAIA